MIGIVELHGCDRIGGVHGRRRGGGSRTGSGDRRGAERWLYRVARNLIIDRYRSRRPTEEYEDRIESAYGGVEPAEDPVEELAASMLGFPAGLFVPTGTMGNQLAVHLQTRPGSEVIIEARGHIFNFEMGAMAVWSGALPRPIVTDAGLLEPGLCLLVLGVGHLFLRLDLVHLLA